MKGIADLLGRIFLSTIFIYEIFDTIFFYSSAKEAMSNFGITWMQDTLLVLVLLMMGIGAFLVVIGYFTRVGATLLLFVWIPFTFIVYSFWNDPPELQRISMLYFMRNLAVIGGLLVLLANGSGEYSVRRLLHVMRLPK